MTQARQAPMHHLAPSVAARFLALITLLALVVPLQAAAATGAEPLHCAPDTGAWRVPPAAGAVAAEPAPAAAGDDGASSSSAPVELRAALCRTSRAACPDFATLTFAAGSEDGGDGEVAARVALSPPTVHTCELQGQGALGGHALYHDPIDHTLLVVDGDTLKVGATAPQAGPGRIFPAPDGARLVLVGESEALVVGLAEGRPSVVGRMPFAELVDVHFLEGRIVVVGARSIVHWPLGADGVLGAGATLPAPEGIVAGGYALDPHAVLRAVEDNRRVLWQPFDDRKPRVTTLGADKILLGFGASGNAAAAVVARPSTGDTEVIALAPDGLLPRIEPRNVALSEADLRHADGSPRPVLVGGGAWLMLDVGLSRSGVLPINTATFEAWELRRALETFSRGHVLYVDDDQFFVTYPEGTNALAAFSVPNGTRKLRVRRSRVEDLGGQVVAVRPMTKRLTLLVGANGRRAVLDRKRGEVDPWPAPPQGSEVLGEPLALVDDRFVVTYGSAATGDSAASVARWRLIDTEGKARDLVPSARLDDALPMAERWFGYCLPGAACAATLPEIAALPGTTDAVSGLAAASAPRSPMTSALALGVALLALIAVTLLKRDALRRADPVIKRPDEPDRFDEASRIFVVGTEVAFDPRGRRVPFDRDLEGFVHQSAWTRLPLRLGCTLVAALGLALPLTASRLIGEPPLDWALATLAIAVPVGALVYVALSWSMWSRLHLLRFGKAVEGTWVDKESRQPRAVYVAAGKTWMLARADATRALPVVLYDPRRPRFAIHYTGSSNLDPATTGYPDKPAGSASIASLPPRLATLALLAACVVAGLLGRSALFPLPLPEAQLQALADADSSDLLVPCLALCAEEHDGDAQCIAQCEHRQLGLTLAQAAVDAPADPDTTMTALRSALADEIDAWVAAAGATRPDTLCSEHAAALPELVPWAPALHQHVARAYGRAEVLDALPELAKVEARIAAARATFFDPLCTATPACDADRGACTVALACAGSPRSLQERICAARPRIEPLDAPAEAAEK